MNRRKNEGKKSHKHEIERKESLRNEYVKGKTIKGGKNEERPNKRKEELRHRRKSEGSPSQRWN